MTSAINDLSDSAFVETSGGPSRPERLRQRSEFVAVSRGARFHSKAFSLQSLRRTDKNSVEPRPRFGFTVTRKVGKSTERNRMRRRLREAVRVTADLPVLSDHDYVLVARREALSLPFATLVADLKLALTNINRRDGKGRHRKPATG
jgi:ribonuclease P protein component